MSEFSDSLHLLHTSIAVAMRSVEAAEATALVLPPRGKHLTLITSDAKKISVAAPGPALWWEYSADHALELELLEQGQLKGRIKINFEKADQNEIEGDAAWHSIAGLPVEPLRELLRPGIVPNSKTWANTLAQSLGLNDFSFVAGRDLKRDERIAELKQRYPEATLFRAGGRMKWLTDAEQARRGDVDSETAARSQEKVSGAPLLVPPPSRKDAAWTVKGTGAIEMSLANIGGEGKGITLELESELFAQDAVQISSVEVDGQPVQGSLQGAKWSASRADLPWPAACDPSSPRPTLKRKIVITFAGKRPATGLLMVRINPAPTAAAKGRFSVGRSLTVS